MRTDSGPASSIIMDFALDKVVVLDHAKKEYAETPLSDMIDQLAQAMATAKKQMQQLPEAQRKELAPMFESVRASRYAGSGHFLAVPLGGVAVGDVTKPIRPKFAPRHHDVRVRLPCGR